MKSTLVRIALVAGTVGSALAVSVAHAQGGATVAPGMSRDEVVRALGKPTGERSSRGYTYLFFANGCERTCGTSDVVTLEDGRVSDAVFRKPGRTYSGNSSSPVATAPSARGVGRASTLQVESRTGPRSAARPARGARASRTPARAPNDAAAAAGQTRSMIVAPRRPTAPSDAIVATDSGVARRGLADTTTSTGTRFGPPLTVAPGPRTPQVPGLGAPPSRDSSVRNGVQLPPGSVPVPFQGARPSSVDSARAANERPRTPTPTPSQPPRPPR